MHLEGHAMDSNHFDELVKSLNTARINRASAVKTLVGGAAALVGARLALDTAEAKKKRKHKKGRGRAKGVNAQYANSITYSGQGLNCTDTCDLKAAQVCGVENGADKEGAYLLWVLTATGANNADITGPWGTASMTKKGNGTFQYASDFYDLDTLIGNVSATYDGKAKNAQLVISHGCLPVEECDYSCTLGYYSQNTCSSSGHPYWNNCGTDPSRSLDKLCFKGFTTNGLAPDTPFYCDTSLTYADALKNTQPALVRQKAAALLNLLGLGCYPLDKDAICAATSPDELDVFNQHGGDTGRICPLKGNCTNSCGDTCPFYTN
jgi:hypothetical protein